MATRNAGSGPVNGTQTPSQDTYPATCPAGVGRYGGVVRHIHKGALAYCGHSHKSRSAALRCAEALLKVVS